MIERLFTRQSSELPHHLFLYEGQVVTEWMRQVRARIPVSEKLTALDLQHLVPDLLVALAEVLAHPGREGAHHDIRQRAGEFGRHRAQVEGYKISDLVIEFGVLREVLFSTFSAFIPSESSTASLIRTALDSGLAQATEEFANERLLAFQRADEIGISDRTRREMESLFNDAPVGICVYEGPQHIHTLVNPSFFKGLPKDQRQVIGKSVREAFPEIEGQGYFELLDQVYQTGQTFVGRETPILVNRPDGTQETLYINLIYQPRFDSRGDVCGIVCVVTEVTELVRARQDVESQQQWLENILNRLPSPLMLIDSEGRQVSFMNRACRDLTETRGGDLEEIKFLDRQGRIVHPDQTPVSRAVAGTELRNEEFGIRVKDEFRHFAVSSEMVPSRKGEQKSALLIMQDITPIKTAQEASEAANSAKSIFLANMSHEIRTPLGAIMGFLDLMKNPLCTREDLAEYVQVIERNSTQLLRLVDDILDLSKVEAGKIAFEKIDFSLGELLSDIHKLMSFKALEKGIHFQVSMATPVPDCLVSDPTRVRQILTNVVGNAIKFTERGRVSVEVEYLGDNLRFTVTDTGRGISREQAAKLFSPFMQADPSTTRSFGGTGLGLILTKRLTEAMGGFFRLKHSEIGQGSCFEACIEVRRANSRKMIPVGALQPVQQALYSHYEMQDLTGMRLLLVEDSVDNQVLLKILLTNLGAQVDLGCDGGEGVSMAMKKPYDAILMDVQMPVMDGHQATRELRSRGYTKPIIALTAHAMLDEKKRCVDSGFSDFLTKPFQREHLVEVLQGYRLH